MMMHDIGSGRQGVSVHQPVKEWMLVA